MSQQCSDSGILTLYTATDAHKCGMWMGNSLIYSRAKDIDSAVNSLLMTVIDKCLFVKEIMINLELRSVPSKRQKMSAREGENYFDLTNCQLPEHSGILINKARLIYIYSHILSL